MKAYPLARGLGILMVAIAGFASVAPAFAVSDVDLLKEYVGDWRGSGTMTGANTEKVVCRMSMLAGNQDKINYTGRCTMAGTTLSINGTVAYIAATKRFEAAMTSNAAFSGKAVGQKRGDSIVFDLKQVAKDDQGNNMNVTAKMTFAGGKISTDFTVVFPSTGDTIKATVPFSR